MNDFELTVSKQTLVTGRTCSAVAGFVEPKSRMKSHIM